VNPDDPLLEVRDAMVVFGGLHALDGVSLSVPRGSITGLIGPNGAGKTTLFNAVSGFVRLTSGAIAFNGRDITSLPAHRRAQLGIGRSFQTPTLIDDATVDTNLLAAQGQQSGYNLLDVLFRPWRHRRGERRLEERASAAAAEFGLGGVRAQAAADLPFGASRWTELAGLLASGAELLMLDEPTTGLDRGETERLARALRTAQRAGRTVFIVAHDVQFVLATCDLLHAMAEGRHIVSGSPREVCDHPEVVEHYLGRRVA
jgi:ABC-type branched-subunit amino acid transport system ATPase component